MKNRIPNASVKKIFVPSNYKNFSSELPEYAGYKIENYKFGKDIKINERQLKEFTSIDRRISELDLDLLWVSGLLAFADRRCRRKRSKDWSRRIVLVIPVYRVEDWMKIETENALWDCLNFLTGDNWVFHFIQRNQSDSNLTQLKLFPPENKITHTIPYSGGMDSYLAVLQAMQFGIKKLALISNRLKKTQSKITRDSLEENWPLKTVEVPIEFSGLRHSEQTYRTRSLLFFVTSAIAARLAGAKTVIIPENGQGSIGPSLIPFACEHPNRSTHPGFTLKLSKLMQLLDGSYPDFVHPNLWYTKSQVINQVAEFSKLNNLTKTSSCGRQMGRITSVKPLPRHCGICTGCLLRRVSLFNCNNPNCKDYDGYYWEKLNESTFGRSVKRKHYPTSENDRDIAIHAIMNMQMLTELIPLDPSLPEINRFIEEISDTNDLKPIENLRKLNQLLNRHSEEWKKFLSELSANSWLIKYLGG